MDADITQAMGGPGRIAKKNKVLTEHPNLHRFVRKVLTFFRWIPKIDEHDGLFLGFDNKDHAAKYVEGEYMADP